ncbi:unnamed protein product [Gordionus sp. m RMFG-2023]
MFIFARSFSTSLAKLNIIKPSLQLYGLEGRYAHALYSAAHKDNKLDNVEKELKKFGDTLHTDNKISSIVFNPLISRKPKKEFIVLLLKKLGFSNMTTNFLSVVIENGRYNKLYSIIKAFDTLMSSHRGEIKAEVITAHGLDKDMMREVELALHGFIKKGQLLKITTKVDPSLIGGMIVKIGDKYVDMSIASKLNAYKQYIQQPV